MIQIVPDSLLSVECMKICFMAKFLLVDEFDETHILVGPSVG